MYESFFGFRERPFQLTANPRYLFLSPSHREALATLRYGLTAMPGITLLLGEAGTGKSTLLRAAVRAEQQPRNCYALLNNPALARAEFFDVLAEALGLPEEALGSKARFLRAFERNVRDRHAAGGLTAIVIDEAQTLTPEVFEEVRLLANLDTDTDKLVSVVLVGQPELAERLNDPALRAFKQRVTLRCSLQPLDLPDTASYVATRIRVAGGVAGEVFTKDAVAAIYEASGGIPRTIGVICENALLAGFAVDRKPVDRSLVADVCGDFDLNVPGRRRPVPSPETEPLAANPHFEAGGHPRTEPQPEITWRRLLRGTWLKRKWTGGVKPEPARAAGGNRLFRFY